MVDKVEVKTLRLIILGLSKLDLKANKVTSA